MTLDQGAREWLSDIETLHDRLFDLQQGHDKLLRARTRAKAAASFERARQKVTNAEAELTAVSEELAAETALFFVRILGITKDSLAVRLEQDGRQSAPLIVNTMAARLLSDKTATFTISGDSMSKNLTNGLPNSEYLLARESAGQSLAAHI
jgi:hypothetical protein